MRIDWRARGPIPWLRRALRALLLVVGTLVLLFEEWGWRPLAQLLGWIARWPPLSRLEARIQRSPRRWAMALFLVPALGLVPVKLGAMWLMNGGHVASGVALLLAAKVVGTAIGGRLFILTERQLMSFPRFARAIRWGRRVRSRLHAVLHRSAAWQAAHRLVARSRAWFGRGKKT